MVRSALLAYQHLSKQEYWFLDFFYAWIHWFGFFSLKRGDAKIYINTNKQQCAANRPISKWSMMMIFKTDTQFPAPSFSTHYRTALKSFNNNSNNNNDNASSSMILFRCVMAIHLYATINTNIPKYSAKCEEQTKEAKKSNNEINRQIHRTMKMDSWLYFPFDGNDGGERNANWWRIWAHIRPTCTSSS